MKKINVVISNDKKKAELPRGSRMLVRRCCNAVLQTEKLNDDTVIFVTFTDNHGLLSVNRTPDANEAMGVVSLPSCENGEGFEDASTGARILGNVMISLEKAKSRAEFLGRTVEHEICYLTAHGVLGLLGYESSHRRGKARMQDKEELILSLLGFPVSMGFMLSRKAE